MALPATKGSFNKLKKMVFLNKKLCNCLTYTASS